MKTFKLGLAAITLFAAVAFSSCKDEAKTEEVVVEEVIEADGLSGTFKMDAEASSFNWLGTKVTGEHSGTINLKEGSFSLNNGELVEGQAVINMASIKVTDIEDAEMNAKLLGHLSTEDFFAVETYPTATLKIESSDGNMAASQLTIKDMTHPIEFEYTLEEADGEVALVGTIVIDRTVYDIQYGSGKFFDNLGDKTISDEFEISFKAVAAM